MRCVAAVAVLCACNSRAPNVDGGAEPDAPADVASQAECQHPGELDPTFGVDGHTGIFPRGYNNLSAVLVDADQRILLGGSVAAELSTLGKLAVVRLLENGELDPSFGVAGVALASVADHDCWLEDIALQSDGAIVGTGGCNALPEGTGGAAVFALVRFLPTGELDATFGAGGIVLDKPALRGHGVAIAVDGQGRIVIAGQYYDANDIDHDIVTARFLSDGAPDQTFGDGGSAIEPFGTARDLANDLVLQPDGRILVAGPTGATDWSYGIVRYNDDGTLDTSYGSGGHATLPQDGAVTGIPHGMALDKNDRAIVVGEHNGSGGGIRLTTDGELDSSFATDGFLASPTVTRQVVVAENQSILITGNRTNPTVELMRLTPDGALDTSFGTSGISTVASPAHSTLASSLAIDERGRIIVGATAVNDPSEVLVQDFFVARFCP